MSIQKLSCGKIERMSDIIGSYFSVHALGDLPDLDIKPEQLVLAIRKRLLENDIGLKDVRINGGFASVIVGDLESSTFNDLDILFNLTAPSSKSTERTRHDFIRKCVVETLVNFLPDFDHTGNGVDKSLVSLEKLAEEYIQKAICVQNGSNDLWSLITLRNTMGKNIELKFVDRLKRKYEFSIDSFQLIINDYLEHLETFPQDSHDILTPTVMVESVFGDFQTALTDLENRLIRTKNPEEIRGGGLLKYCYLISCGYSDADPSTTLKKYMCSRFFIDFPELQRQQVQLENYLANHFSGSDNSSKNTFLSCVLCLIHKHSVCLPSRERNRTLAMIHTMALQYVYPNTPSPISNNQHSTSTDNTHMQQQQQQPPQKNSPVSFSYPNLYSTSNLNNAYNIYNSNHNNNNYSVYNSAFSNLHLSFYTSHILPQQPVIQS